jgi:hypothetical protein
LGLIMAGAFVVAALAVTAVLSADKKSSLTTFRNSYVTFSAPAAWGTHVFPARPSPHETPLVYVSSQTLHDPCRPVGAGTACGWPVDRLEPGGVLIVWENRSFPGWTLESAEGKPVTIGGRAGRRASIHPGECVAVGGDKTVEVAIERPVPSSWTAVTACLRGPDLAQATHRLDALLGSTRFLAQ